MVFNKSTTLIPFLGNMENALKSLTYLVDISGSDFVIVHKEGKFLQYPNRLNIGQREFFQGYNQREN